MNVEIALAECTNELVGDQIATDVSLQTKLSEIRKKLQNLARTLQI